MSETKKRNVHLAEFKAKAGLEGVRGVMMINEIAQAHGVYPVQVSHWKKKIQEQTKTLFEGKRGPQPVAGHSAPDRLYGEIGRLKMVVYLGRCGHTVNSKHAQRLMRTLGLQGMAPGPNTSRAHSQHKV